MRLLVSILGKIEYQESLEIQQHLLKLRQQDKIADVLLLVEHFPVITIGKSGSRSNIIKDEEELRMRGVEVYEVFRGGDVTYHGPGQIVGYPILDLKNHGRDLRQYIWLLEEVFMQLLKQEYNVIAHRDPNYRGVWLGEDKITAIGCAVKKYVTMHGFAFNVNTRLEHFTWITPCGIEDKGVTSLQQVLGHHMDIEEIKMQVVKYFAQVFRMQPYIIEKEALVDL